MVSSSMVIKVDFDLTISILAHNLYRLFARYDHSTVEKEKKSSSDTGDNAKIFSPEIPLA